MCDFLRYFVNQGHFRFAFFLLLPRFSCVAIRYSHFGEEHQALMDISCGFEWFIYQSESGLHFRPNRKLIFYNYCT